MPDISKIHVNLITPTSISVELENHDCYSTEPFEVFLNGTSLGMREHNSFSLHELEPGHSYELRLAAKGSGTYQFSFRTKNRREIIYHSPGDDGTENVTAGLQQAIDSLADDEFLTVRGVCRVTSLFLRDNLILHLPKGSRLVGETDRTAFPVLKASEEKNGIPLGTWEGCADDSFASILTGIGVRNVCIYGEGTVDCNAQAGDWWIDHRTKRIARRPKGIFLHTCENIALEGITVCNTPSWNQHPFYSRHLKYINMNLINPPDSPTTDGIDPESCHDVDIVGVRISVGDDCIAVKSGKIDFARRYHTPSSRITIRNCLMEYGHGGVTLGSENSGGIQDVLVTNCIFRQTDRGLRIKSQRGRGNLAVIQNITFRNIRMDDVKAPFVINAFYKAGNDEYDRRFVREYQEPSDLTPVFREFAFEDIFCHNVWYGVGFFLGLPESMLEKVALKNISVSYRPDASPGQMAMTAWKEEFLHMGFVCENVKLLELEHVRFQKEPDRKFILNNVTEVRETE